MSFDPKYDNERGFWTPEPLVRTEQEFRDAIAAERRTSDATIERLRDELRARDAEVAVLRMALERSAESWLDVGRTMKMLGRHNVAEACQYAEQDARAALAAVPAAPPLFVHIHRINEAMENAPPVPSVELQDDLSQRQPDNDMVICPGCTHQFAAIPVNVQRQLAEPQERLCEWAVSRWRIEVENRPLVNVHRRTLDDTWRQVIRFAGGDPDALVGPSHDELAARPKPELQDDLSQRMRELAMALVPCTTKELLNTGAARLDALQAVVDELVRLLPQLRTELYYQLDLDILGDAAHRLAKAPQNG